MKYPKKNTRILLFHRQLKKTLNCDINSFFFCVQNSYGLQILEDLRNHKISFDGIRAPALAARISGDKSAFFNCGFVGFQDTLWDELGRHYFQGCRIEGAVDFIFGDGQSYYRVLEIDLLIRKIFTSLTLINQLIEFIIGLCVECDCPGFHNRTSTQVRQWANWFCVCRRFCDW